MNTIPIIIDKTMDKVKLMEVIYCTKKRAGRGIEHDPIREVTEIYSTDGILIADRDVYIKFSAFDMIDFGRYVLEDINSKENVPDILEKWCKTPKKY